MDILVAGASGSVGGELCRRLDRPGMNLRRVSRSGPDAWHIGAEPPPEPLRRHWDVIVNAVADTRWSLKPEEAHAANVDTTRELFALAAGDTHVVHVSTIGVEGRAEVAAPERLEDFHNTYEWAKAKAEALVRQMYPRADIVRLPLIGGRRADGFIDRFGGLFGLLRGLCSGAIPAIVGEPDAYVDIAPTDDAAKLIDRLITAGPADGTRVAVLGGGVDAPTLDVVMKITLEALNEWRAGRGTPALEQPPYVRPRTWDGFYLPLARKHLSPGQLSTVEAYDMFRPYFKRTHPLDVTHRVGDPADSVSRSVTWWADRHAATAARMPRPWTLIKNGEL
jgi:nucleoside-diphosphate-sugar epimerase